MSDIIVGIDLGTTNSALAAVIDGDIKVIDIHGQQTMPSCVGVDPTGKLIVGQAARNQLVSSPENTILSIKRHMGTQHKVSLQGKEFSPEEISSLILRELKVEAEKTLGQPVKKAVITVPAFFNENQRKSTQLAGELAGLEVVRIINEPTAAALAYGAARIENEKLLVYDLGGGTFDVSVVTVEQGVVEVRASHGDTHLGGDDFDDLLVNAAIEEFKSRHDVDLSSDAKALRRLKVALETAKIHLSDEPFATIREEYLDGKNHLEWEVSRDDYESLISPLLDKTLSCLSQSLTDAKASPGDLDKIMLVGGASRTPLVHRLIEEKLHQEPKWEINPDLIVAMGAAVQGSIIAGQMPHAVLVDISAHTFSTTTVSMDGYGMVSFPIIPRGTPLPATKADLFFTIHDNQKEVEVEATQGEGATPEQNLLIGKFRISGLSKVPAGSPIVIKYQLDLNGMLQVTATEKNTGLAKTATMDTRGAKPLDLDSARRNIASLFGEMNEDDEAEEGEDDDEAEAEDEDDAVDSSALLATAKDLRKRSEALLEKSLSAEDAAEIRSLLNDISHAVSAQAWDVLGEKNNALSDLLFYLED